MIPFAAPLSDAGRAALRSLALPQLRQLLGRLAPAGRSEGDELSFTPPHERVLAQALGWAGDDGTWPLAAWRAAAHGIEVGNLAWGQLTPVHWHVGTDQVSLLDPALLRLDEATSRAVYDAVAELFTSEGFVLHHAATGVWFAAHESLAALRTASLDRVIGRNVDRWLTEAHAVRLVRRLQNEVQMLLYTHPLNDRREAQGLLPVNSFWLSGCGRAQAVQGEPPRIDERLRAPALAEDWAAWCKAWDVVDASLEGVTRLTLCGERAAVTLAPAGRWQRVQAAVRRTQPADLLETL